MHKEFNEWVLRNNIELIPEAHGFKVGEVVTVINGYGIPFHNMVIKGIEKEPRTYGGQFYVWDDAYWFPVEKERLIKQKGEIMKIENFIALIEKSSKESLADEFRCPRIEMNTGQYTVCTSDPAATLLTRPKIFPKVGNSWTLGRMLHISGYGIMMI